MGGNAFSNRGLFDASGAARPVAASVKAPVRRRDMPIIGADEARHYANVASLPCMRPGCGQVAPSTVAHSNALMDGKARGMKAPFWAVAALCPTYHHEIDHGNRLSKFERRELWLVAHKRTTHELFARGLIRPVTT